MKVRVTYTYEIVDEDLAALERYQQQKITRDVLRQCLHDLGTLGVEEQIHQGWIWLDTAVEK